MMSHSHKHLDSRHSIDSCTLHLHNWRPFHIQNSNTLDSDSPKPYSSSNGVYSKRPCLSDRATSFSIIDAIDMSKLSLIDDDKSITTASYKRPTLRLVHGKRRRRGSRSVSGRSSDRGGTRRCCSAGASAAYGTCSDFHVAIATDSSGELFMNGEANWASDVSEAKNSRRDRDNGSGEKENLGVGFGQFGGLDAPGNESGYGSEPGYRGDAEFGYGDEFDEEEDEGRLLFWGEHLGDSKVEMVGENTFSDQKSHYRCRRKKHDCRMVYSPKILFNSVGRG